VHQHFGGKNTDENVGQLKVTQGKMIIHPMKVQSQMFHHPRKRYYAWTRSCL